MTWLLPGDGSASLVLGGNRPRGGRGLCSYHGQVAAGSAAAAQHDDLGIPAVLGDQLPDPGCHSAAVAEDVADHVRVDAVVDTDVVVLAASVADPAPRDAAQADPAGQV